ncbi:MAG: Smr/MutS family protein [Erysipelotrichaceae bacterium]|nr:Smr/MutS family protein [Erysipelotrichaceae bacterium]
MTDYNNLDLHVIKEKIGEFASIAEAKSFILNEEVSFNPLKIRKNVKETAEFLELLNKNETFSFEGIYNVDSLLEKADKNIMLSGLELKNILVFHNHCNRIKRQFQKYDPELSVRDYSDSLNINEDIFRQIENCIDNSGEVKDDASDRLKSISRELEACEKDLYNRAHSFIDRHMSSLQETSIYLRNERITFLIKSSDKNKYQGYTYGSSSSGLAYYVEPQSFIEGNNRKISLMHDREDEIVRILQHLSYLVASISQQYSYNFECLLSLCVIYAKARYGYNCNGIIGELCEGEYFSFSDLCHPLIDQKKVVSNSYRLYPPYRGIVISGSNTGGKTVSLKAIGLSILMTYLGMPIIASKAQVPIYKDIFVDIDDNQSIEDSLSTFSAHISNINSILKNADDRSLILIDELISGTDPKEAQAISLAILDKIKELGSKFIITTHFDDIKNYSYKDEEILLSSVGFNMDTLTPTYRYLEDSVGSSNALEIASRYIDDPELITNAKAYLVRNKSEQEELLDKLSRQIEENEILKDELNSRKNEYETLHKEYQDKITEFALTKDRLKAEYEKKLNDELSQIIIKANEKLENIKENKEEAKKIISEIEELSTEEVKEEKIEFKAGDNVRIKDNEQIGVISSINNDTATISIRGLTVKAKLNDLILMPKIRKHETKVISKTYKRVPGEINLVGERVEDGLVLMEEYLDKANASHMSSVKVIHGIGTGMLRSALRNRLKKLSYVKSFKDGDYYDGGSAVTIVEFK